MDMTNSGLPVDPEQLPVDPAQLLADCGWMQPLARSLVRSAADADDVLQDTWVAFLERAPRVHSPAAWLRSVIVNLTRRKHRDESRRRRRHVLLPATEPESVRPHDLIERAELQRAVADAVLGLSEPFQTTVLLRFFGEQTPKQIAEEMGVPQATVYTRLRRAMDQLRTALDGSYSGERTAWLGLLAPLAGLRLESVAPQATVAATMTASGVGGVAMSSKVVAVLLAAVAVLAGVSGAALDRWLLQESDEGISIADYRNVEAERQQLQREFERVTGRVVTLERRLAQASAPMQDPTPRANPTTPSPVAAESQASIPEETDTNIFGHWSHIKGVRSADWSELADATLKINELMLSLLYLDTPGEAPPPNVMALVREERARLSRYASRVADDLPTAGIEFGELTHPATVGNLLTAMLDHKGVPLSPEQKQLFEQVGVEYDREYRQLQESYTEETFRLQRVLDELTLKGDIKDQFLEILDKEQRASVTHPALEGRARVDPLSPVLLVQGVTAPKRFATTEQIRDFLPGYYAEQLGVEQAAIEPHAELFDDYVKAIEPTLVPEHPDLLYAYTRQQAETAGVAYWDVLTQLLEVVPIEDSKYEDLQQSLGWLVPRLVPVATERDK